MPLMRLPSPLAELKAIQAAQAEAAARKAAGLPPARAVPPKVEEIDGEFRIYPDMRWLNFGVAVWVIALLMFAGYIAYFAINFWDFMTGSDQSFFAALITWYGMMLSDADYYEAFLLISVPFLSPFLIFFCVKMVRAATRLEQGRRPVLRINDAGFEDTRNRQGLVRWSDVEKIELGTLLGYEHVFVQFKARRTLLQTLLAWQRTFRLAVSGREITAHISRKDLLDIMQKRWRAATRGAGGSDQATAT